MASDERLTLAIPMDVLRLFDVTIGKPQLEVNRVLNSPDDIDALASMIEDAENELRQYTGMKFGIGRRGLPGERETFETLTYELSGHNTFKRNFTGVWSDYDPDEKRIMLEKERVLPFDPTLGDAVYLYGGLRGDGDSWIDVTAEEGDMWAILNNIAGEFVFDPYESYQAAFEGATTDSTLGGGTTTLKRARFAISYRYGGLGGSSMNASETALDASLTDTETGTVAVTDGSGFPTAGTAVMLVDREYIEVETDPANDQMNIVDRGLRGTTPDAHDAGARVQYTPPSIRKAVAARAGQQLVQSRRYSDWLPDTEDDLDMGDVADDMEAIWQGTVDVLSG